MQRERVGWSEKERELIKLKKIECRRENAQVQQKTRKKQSVLCNLSVLCLTFLNYS